jgi:hypothetical protein
MPTVSIKTVWDLTRALCKKHNTAYLDPDQFNLYINRAQVTKFMELYGNPQEYQPGLPAPRIAYEVTQKVTDDLRQFKKEAILTVDSDGKSNYPADYVHTLSIGKNDRPIEVVRQELEMYRRSSKIVGPTVHDPICVLKETYYQFYPKDIASAELSYLRQPQEAKFAVTIVSGRPVYDPTLSINLEWPDVAVNDIVMRALSYIGISIKDAEILQYAETLKKTGN